ncbi:hypothetical protein Sjap_017296 [Stephania japonica]|uniref:Uncharacterized protein n=1 Tax=Stephania japonica TaxID=461633 RepID=A0AAP0I5W4_9MAGN
MISSEINHISTKTICPSNPTNPTLHHITLTPWDLKYLTLKPIQMGLLFPNSTLIHHLETSLSLTLNHFYPLAGRLSVATYEHNNTISVHIDCNNAGAEFIHAKVNVTVADIMNSVSVPHVVRAFFPLNGTINYDGRKGPLLSVQATELFDGIFIGITMNHVVVDGDSFWHFVNSWAEMSRNGSNDQCSISIPPVLRRWFPNDTEVDQRPAIIRFNLDLNNEQNRQQITLPPPSPLLEERVFHFSSQSLAQLKAKANAEHSTAHKISSLQAVLAHIWLAMTRARRIQNDAYTTCIVPVGNRSRLVPPLPKEYFGCAVYGEVLTAKVGDLVEKGLGGTAKLLNKAIEAHDDAAIRRAWDAWVEAPKWWSRDNVPSNLMATQNSPRFNVYGNDFGWGRPVAALSGFNNKLGGLVTVYEGSVEGGSMDFEVCLEGPVLEALSNDAEFMKAFAV